MKNIVILLSAGMGSRMSCEIPKQFMKINNKEIFRYSLETFLNNRSIDLILLCISTKHETLWRTFLEEYNSSKIEYCFGGETRLDSFLLSMKFLEKFNLEKNSKIITHDIARPFVSNDIIDNHISLLENYFVVNTVLPIDDSIVYLNNDKLIEKYLDRKHIYKVQTPQSFVYREFFNLNWSIINKESITDICCLFFNSNINIFNLIGSKKNIKITDASDLDISAQSFY